MKNITEVMSTLKTIRKAKKITTKEVADYIKQEAGISVSTRTIHRWEYASTKPDATCFVAMCKLYGIEDIHELFN